VLTTFYTVPSSGNSADGINGLHFSTSFNAVFISTTFDTYQVDAATGLIVRKIWQGYGSKDVVTDSNKQIFVEYQGLTTDYIRVWPDIVKHVDVSYEIMAFWRRTTGDGQRG